MAFTVSTVKDSVFGDMRVKVLSITADAATQNVDSGLSRIYGHALGPLSMTTASAKLYINSLTTGTAAAGYIAVSGVASGDVFILTVWGV